MFKKIVEFFTGKKPETVTAPPVSAPYKLEPPADMTPIPYVPAEPVPIPYRYEPPAAETTPPVAVLISPEVEQQKKPRKPAVKKPVVAKPPTKPRAKKTPQ